MRQTKITGRKSPKLPIGVVFSKTGPYQTTSSEMHDGAMLAIDEVNASAAYDFQIEPHVFDPGGDLDAYYRICDQLLSKGTARHVIGCYTSSSRKEVIPVFEKRDGLLWYPSHYEGFESSGNVVYTGAAPNQHIVPLTEHMLRHHGRRPFLVGSNYIWAWENNRVMRGLVGSAGGQILAERYLPVGSTDVGAILQEILKKRPSYIFSSLIGLSSQALLSALCELRKTHPELAPEIMPLCSVTLSEPELRVLGSQAGTGHIVSSVYFQTLNTLANKAFVSAFRARYGTDRVTSADAEAAYIAVKLLAEAIAKAGTDEISQVMAALDGIKISAPQGTVQIERQNSHCYLTPSLGRSRADGQFDPIWTADSPFRPDPYLIALNIDKFRTEFSTEPDDHCHPDRDARFRVVQ